MTCVTPQVCHFFNIFVLVHLYNRLNMAEDEASVINIDPNGDATLEVSCPDGKIHLSGV